MPNADTTAIRNKARRLKDLAITRAIFVLEHPDEVSKDIYNETYQTVLKNAVPRSQEITGEEGQAINITFDKVFNESNTPQEATGDSPV